MAGSLEQYEILGETSKIPGWAAQAKDKGRFPPGAGTFKIYYKTNSFVTFRLFRTN